MNMAVKATAAQFLADHEQLGSDLETANLRIEDQRKELEKLDVKVSLLTDALAQANTDKNTFLQYSFELAAQLQFIVAGSARALMIAGQVRNAIAMKAANIPPVAGADIAELEGILHRIGEHNETANDGAGMTNKPIGIDAPLVAASPIPETIGVEVGDGLFFKADAEIQRVKPGAVVNGTLVDRDGNPIETSNATRMIKGL